MNCMHLEALQFGNLETSNFEVYKTVHRRMSNTSKPY